VAEDAVIDHVRVELRPLEQSTYNGLGQRLGIYVSESASVAGHRRPQRTADYCVSHGEDLPWVLRNTASAPPPITALPLTAVEKITLY
jgi:hypothetical protein